MRTKTFKLHGVMLPEGAAIHNPENVSIGKDFNIGLFCQLFCQDVENGSELIIGDRVILNLHSSINADCGGKVHIGDNVIIGPMCVLRASNHSFDSIDTPIRDQGHNPGRIEIQDDVWIGAGVIVLPDVTIGKSSIIGAGSIVTKDIPPCSIAVGNPAKVIGGRKQRS